MRNAFYLSVAMLAMLVVAPTANAQWGNGRGFNLSINTGGGYGGNYNPGGYVPGGYYSSGYRGGHHHPRSYNPQPYNAFYGTSGADFQPHWHQTQTPYGTQAWYGNGPHDSVPHQHVRTPGSYQGFSNTAAGPTTSYYPTQPNYYTPW